MMGFTREEFSWAMDEVNIENVELVIKTIY